MTGRIKTTKTPSKSANSLPEIGKIKTGIKAKTATGTEYPKAIDYFRPTGNFAAEFTKIFGEKPKQIHIAFISDNIQEVCNEQFECWDKGKRFGYGDGETFTVWDSTKKAYIDGLLATDQKVRSLKWDRTLTLRFVILKMQGILGYWTYQTKAKEVTIPSIVKSFDLVREKAGTIIGFPFNLMVEFAKSYSPGEAKQYPVVKLVPHFTEDTIEQVRAYVEAGGAMNRLTTKMIESGTLAQSLQIGGGE